MWLYQALSRVFPRSFTAKVLFPALCGIQMPLLALLFWFTARSETGAQHADLLGLVLGVTMVGTALTLWALRAILAPLIRIESTLADFEKGVSLPHYPLIFGMKSAG